MLEHMFLILETKLGIVTWLWSPLNFLFLIMDGIVYTLVALSYRVFQMMAQLNFNTLGSLFTSLTDRVRAIIAVLILFIIAYSLIMYLVNPDKAADKNTAGGIALIKNIAIASLLLIAYPTIFGIMNEFTLLLVGTPDTYDYIYLGDIFNVEGTAEDEGLIMRFINGGDGLDDETEEMDFGEKLAITTLSSFLHGFEDKGLYSKSGNYDKSMVGEVFKTAVAEKDFNIIFSLPSITLEVGRSVYYFPILSTALGAYIVYMIATVSIQLGIRAFKLLVLQLIAPIAIITIMKDGWKAKVWSKYLDVLGKTYADAFIRIAAMYFSFSFISLAYNNLGKIFDGAKDVNGVTRLALYGIIIAAVLKLGKEIPSMIDSIFGSKLAENNKTGLGQFLSAAGGYVLGSASGGISGAATRFKNARAKGAGVGRSLLSGAMGAASGATLGSVAGAGAGFKAKDGKIVEAIKNSASEGWRVGGPGIAGYVMGAAESVGITPNSRLELKEQHIQAYEQERDAYRKTQGKRSVTHADTSISYFDSSRTKHTYTWDSTAAIEFDYSKGKDEAINKAMDLDTEFSRIKADMNSQDSSISSQAIDAARKWKKKYTDAYNEGAKVIDNSNTKLVGMAEQIAKENAQYYSSGLKDSDILDNPAKIGEIKNHIAYEKMQHRNASSGKGGSK